MCLNPYCIGTCSRSLVENHSETFPWIVLILIVLEHALGVVADAKGKEKESLNPYCIGTCSRSLLQTTKEKTICFRLNPYCIGTCSRR